MGEMNNPTGLERSRHTNRRSIPTIAIPDNPRPAVPVSISLSVANHGQPLITIRPLLIVDFRASLQSSSGSSFMS